MGAQKEPMKQKTEQDILFHSDMQRQTGHFLVKKMNQTLNTHEGQKKRGLNASFVSRTLGFFIRQ